MPGVKFKRGGVGAYWSPPPPPGSSLVRLACAWFTDERNPPSKEMILKRVDGYMKRAEHLKEIIDSKVLGLPVRSALLTTWVNRKMPPRSLSLPSEFSCAAFPISLTLGSQVQRRRRQERRRGRSGAIEAQRSSRLYDCNC
jgi:hypothetical protein